MAVPVNGPDFNWTTVAVVLLNVLVGGLLVALVKRKPALVKLANERDANLLSERAKEMQEMRERIERLEEAADRKDHQHAAEIARYRHRINNLDQAFNAPSNWSARPRNPPRSMPWRSRARCNDRQAPL
jgi:Skp family chaperone for outer membrane proteins